MSRTGQDANKVNQDSKVEREATNNVTKVTASIRTVQVEGLLPFTAAIMESPMLKNSTPLTFKMYDGTTDPDDHFRSFVNVMAFYLSSDPVMCWAFSLSLKGEALAWNNTLPPNTVDYFTIVQSVFGK